MNNLTIKMLKYLEENYLNFNRENIIYLCENHWGTELLEISHTWVTERTPFGVYPMVELIFKTDIKNKEVTEKSINNYDISYDMKGK